ncbi:MAG: glycosyltransferase family 2 protein [Thermoflexales bacterium]
MSLSVVIPAYNEEHGIAEIVRRVLDARASTRASGIGDVDLIVVDDGSRDGTAAAVSQIEGARLVRHVANHGYGAALKTGFSCSTGEFIAFLDADGTYPPESLPDLCRAALAGADLVIGSRMAGEKSEMPTTRRLGNWFFAGLLSLIGQARISDSASGMRVIRRSALERLYPLPDGLNFTPVMSTRAVHEGLKMVEVPIVYSERIGRSKLSVVRDGVRFFNSIVWTALTYNPARMIGMVGLAGVLFAALVIVWLAVQRLSGITVLGRAGTFLVYFGGVCGVAGVSLVNLGIMFNYLVSLFQKRAVRQGMFGKPLFDPPIDRQFWWMGLLAIAAGAVLGIAVLVTSPSGDAIQRSWLWMLGAAFLVLVGVQVLVSWMVMRVLDEISGREELVRRDLANDPAKWN